MLLGEQKQTIDEKGGLLLPRQYSLILSSEIVVTRGFDRNLMLFAHDGWQNLASKIISRPLSYPKSRALRRRIFSNATVLTADQSGSIQIPASLCDFAALRDEVVLAGMYDYLEIWSSQMWAAVFDGTNGNEDGSIWETIGV